MNKSSIFESDSKTLVSFTNESIELKELTDNDKKMNTPTNSVHKVQSKRDGFRAWLISCILRTMLIVSGCVFFCGYSGQGGFSVNFNLACLRDNYQDILTSQRNLADPFNTFHSQFQSISSAYDENCTSSKLNIRCNINCHVEGITASNRSARKKINLSKMLFPVPELYQWCRPQTFLNFQARSVVCHLEDIDNELSGVLFLLKIYVSGLFGILSIFNIIRVATITSRYISGQLKREYVLDLYFVPCLNIIGVIVAMIDICISENKFREMYDQIAGQLINGSIGTTIVKSQVWYWGYIGSFCGTVITSIISVILCRRWKTKTNLK